MGAGAVIAARGSSAIMGPAGTAGRPMSGHAEKGGLAEDPVHTRRNTDADPVAGWLVVKGRVAADFVRSMLA